MIMFRDQRAEQVGTLTVSGDNIEFHRLHEKHAYFVYKHILYIKHVAENKLLYTGVDPKQEAGVFDARVITRNHRNHW